MVDVGEVIVVEFIREGRVLNVCEWQNLMMN